MTMTPKHVMHDDLRWKVIGPCDIDGDEGYVLSRMATIRVQKPDSLEHTIKRRAREVHARVSDCQPDIHEPKRKIKFAGHVLDFNGRTGILRIRKARTRKGYDVTLPGLLLLCARQEAFNAKANREHQRRIRRGK